MEQMEEEEDRREGKVRVLLPERGLLFLVVVTMKVVVSVLLVEEFMVV